MHWFYLALAGALEIVWAVGLKYTEGFTRPMATLVTVAAMVGSVVLLGLALRAIPVGTGYAVWTGIGAAGSVLLGMALFRESRDVRKLLFIAMIIAGVAGLRVVGA